VIPSPEDADADGFTPEQGDCDDTEPLINPWAADEPANGKDEDCNGSDAAYCFLDADGDSFGGSLAHRVTALSGSCEGEVGLSSSIDDCADNNSTIHPGATEICDGMDNDCDGQIDEDIDASDLVTGYPDVDQDGDGGIGSSSITVCRGGNISLSQTNTDCDDSEAKVFGTNEFGEAPTELCDGMDNNCDGVLFTGEEVDVDGDGSPNCGTSPCPDCICQQPFPWDSALCGDCDDDRADVFPGSWERCGDGINNDCDEAVDEIEDADGDGFTNCGDPLPDCDDGDAEINPDAPENPDNCVDDNCDGQIESIDNDGDGWDLCAGDCDDTEPNTHPERADPCNRNDDDCDGMEDEDGSQILVVGGDSLRVDELRDFLGTDEANGGYCTASMDLGRLTSGTDLTDFELIIVGPHASTHEGSYSWPSPPNAFTDIVIDSYYSATGVHRPTPSILAMGYTGKALSSHLLDFQDQYDWDEDGSADNGLVFGSEVQFASAIGESQVQCAGNQSNCGEGPGAQQGRALDQNPPGCSPLNEVLTIDTLVEFDNHHFYLQPEIVSSQNNFSTIVDGNHSQAGRAYPLWPGSEVEPSDKIQSIGAPGCAPSGSSACWYECSTPRATILRERIRFLINNNSAPVSAGPASPQTGEPWLYYWGVDAPIVALDEGGRVLFNNLVHWATGCPSSNPNCNGGGTSP